MTSGPAGGDELAPLALRLLALRRKRDPDATLATAVRFTAGASLAFPAAEAAADAGNDAPVDAPAQVRADLCGLVGAMGALPAPYTALTASQAGGALPAFVEGLQHPLVLLLLRAHLQRRFWFDEAAGGERPFLRVLHALTGVIDAPARAATGLPPALFAHYCGLLLQHPPSATALEALLHDALALPVAVRQLRGGWTRLDDGQSAGGLGGESPPALGVDTVLGDRVFLPAAGLDLDLGPLSLAQLQALLPGSSGARELVRLVQFALGPQQGFRYRLHLDPAEAPAPALAGDGDRPQRLGWTMWIADLECSAFAAGPFDVAPLAATGPA